MALRWLALRRGLLHGSLLRFKTTSAKTTAWEALDALETAERVRLSAIMSALRDTNTPEKEDFPVDSGHDPHHQPHYEVYPPSPSSCALLLEHLRNGGGVSYQFAARILVGSAATMRSEPRVRRASAKRAVVVGDLHGSVMDLCASMDIAGAPKTRENVVVFNGDFVDRGGNSIEVLIAVLALKLAFHDAVHVNRGNHEDVELSKVYDFERELYDNYDGNRAKKLLGLADRCFASMPVAIVVNDENLVLHGHLPRTMPPLADLLALPQAGSVASVHYKEKGVSAAKHPELLLQDVLWSDPDHDDVVTNDFSPNYRRGAGVVIADVALRQYLRSENLSRLIRSHEVTALGADRVDLGDDMERWTVFSCARYPHGEGLNKAAVLVLSEEGACEPRRWGYVVQSDEGTAFDARVRGLLRRHRAPLKSIALDRPHLDAATACAEALGGGNDLLWRRYLLPAATRGLPRVTSAGDVADLAASLRFEDDRDARVSRRHKLPSTSYRHSTVAAFNALDLDHDGTISYDEFIVFVQTFVPHLQSHDADAAWLFLDTDDSNSLDIAEFHYGFSHLGGRRG